MEKTNVMRILDQNKIKYQAFEYPHEDGVCVEGSQVARMLNEDPKCVFKTLVTVGQSKRYYVFVIPVMKELNLKLCAKAVKEKSIEMISVKELLPLTGYIRGGCSPIGMKKKFNTIIDSSARNLDYIIFSAGKIGYQVLVNPSDLNKVIKFEYAEISA